MSRLALVALAASGCAVAAGSSKIGQWRPHRVIDSTACLQAPTGGCTRTVAIGRDVPARTFGGGLFAFGNTGYAQLRRDSEVSHGAFIDGYYEYFRGRGRFALGGRVGVTVGVGFQSHLLFLVPVTMVAHAGGRWGEAYVGAGYAPVATRGETSDDPDVPPPPATWYHDSFHALIGTRVLLRETYTQAISVNPELRAQTFADGVLLSVTANLGLHF